MSDYSQIKKVGTIKVLIYEPSRLSYDYARVDG